jgi:hypothetical protein
MTRPVSRTSDEQGALASTNSGYYYSMPAHPSATVKNPQEQALASRGGVLPLLIRIASFPGSSYSSRPSRHKRYIWGAEATALSAVI